MAAIVHLDRRRCPIDRLDTRMRRPSCACGFDDVVCERTSTKNGVTIAAVSQVAADLPTSPGRGPNEAEALMQWMQENEDAWRA